MKIEEVKYVHHVSDETECNQLLSQGMILLAAAFSSHADGQGNVYVTPQCLIGSSTIPEPERPVLYHMDQKDQPCPASTGTGAANGNS